MKVEEIRNFHQHAAALNESKEAAVLAVLNEDGTVDITAVGKLKDVSYCVKNLEVYTHEVMMKRVK